MAAAEADREEKMNEELPKEEAGDKLFQMPLGKVHAYTDFLKNRGYVEYVGNTIHVKSKHPLDECVRRGIFEDFHREIGKRIKNYHDCFASVRAGRVYNPSNDGDLNVDAATVWAIFLRTIDPQHYKRINFICFTEPDIDGNYLSEKEYALLFPLALNYQASFEIADRLILEARKTVESRHSESGE